MNPLRPFQDDPQEQHLRQMGWTTLVVLAIAAMFVCWWLYQGVGFFKDEMSFNYAYGPRKAPRIPLPAGTVPRDGMGYDNSDFGLPPLRVTFSPALGAKLYHDQCAFCHAASGRGDAPAGIEYNPAPPDLNQILPRRSDAQLFAAISDGMVTNTGVATTPKLGPRWHAFRLYLSEAQRDQLVDYLRQRYGSGIPEAPPATTIQEPAYHIVGNPPASVRGQEQGAFPSRPRIETPVPKPPNGPQIVLPEGPVGKKKKGSGSGGGGEG